MFEPADRLPVNVIGLSRSMSLTGICQKNRDLHPTDEIRVEVRLRHQTLKEMMGLSNRRCIQL